ncbi:MAG: TfuA-like protein [Geminicoccaceae bacterium]
MTVYVFAGPTLSHAEGQSIFDAIYLPPTAQGDVSKISMQRPSAIGIIDGYFHRMPSVWHKEILLAMASGIHVFGSASMGALRAAELHSFGMVGVGRIFEGYAAGDITDDDEVAVVHGPAEAGYIALSDAMVNIRATFDAAAKDDIITSTTAQGLTDIAKATFFYHRRYDALLDAGADKDLPADELSRLQEWLPYGKIDLKKNDAIQMLRSIDDFLKKAPPRKTVDYFVEPTYVHMDGA